MMEPVARTIFEDVVAARNLDERLDPAQLSEIQAAASSEAAAKSTSVSTIKTSTVAVAKSTTSKAATVTTKAAAGAATVSTSINTATVTSVERSSSSSTSKVTSTSSSSKPVTSSSVHSSSVSVPSKTASSSFSKTSIFSSTSSSSKTSTSAQTVTSKAASASASSAADISKSTRMSTGSIVGIVFAVLIGLVILGSIVGWLYRKYASRSYSSAAPWSKIEEVTPYPRNEKPPSGDLYDGSSESVLGSNRQLAMARSNSVPSDGFLYPSLEAGIGRRTDHSSVDGPYPDPPSAAVYGIDPQGRPYNNYAGRTPMSHTVQQQYTHSHNGYPPSAPYNSRYKPNRLDVSFSPSYETGRNYHGPNAEYGSLAYSSTPPQDNFSRQLVGPGYAYGASPMMLGRPSAPTSYNDIVNHEQYSDNLDQGHGMLAPYDDSEPYTPRTATSMTEWAGDPLRSSTTINRPLVSMSIPQASISAPAPLPALTPMSPLMNPFDFGRASQSFPTLDANDETLMPPEATRTASNMEYVTPDPPVPTSSEIYREDSSLLPSEQFPSARLPRVPAPAVSSGHYQHGQPLSPLHEVPTPLSTTASFTNGIQLSSEASYEVNPFEQLAPAAQISRGLPSTPPPISAPSFLAHRPPPSPGILSVPGSVTDSPSRGPWSSNGRQVSMGFDDDDAYDGI